MAWPTYVGCRPEEAVTRLQAGKPGIKVRQRGRAQNNSASKANQRLRTLLEEAKSARLKQSKGRTLASEKLYAVTSTENRENTRSYTKTSQIMSDTSRTSERTGQNTSGGQIQHFSNFNEQVRTACTATRHETKASNRMMVG